VKCAELGEVGSLQLGYAASASSALTSAIKQFQIAFPHVLLTLHEMTSLDQLNGLHYRTLDAGVVRQSGGRCRQESCSKSGIGRRWWRR